MKRLVIALLVLVLGVPLGASAKNRPAHEQRSSYRISYYFVASETDYAGRPKKLLGRNGQVVATVPSGFAKAVRLQGTGRLRSGQLIHCALPKGRCRLQKQNVVRGSAGWPLQSLRSVAVDRRVIRLGTPVYIEAFVGLKLPDGSTHDGWFLAADTGGKVKGRMLDIFTGTRANYRRFVKPAKIQRQLEVVLKPSVS